MSLEDGLSFLAELAASAGADWANSTFVRNKMQESLPRIRAMVKNKQGAKGVIVEVLKTRHKYSEMAMWNAKGFAPLQAGATPEDATAAYKEEIRRYGRLSMGVPEGHESHYSYIWVQPIGNKCVANFITLK